MNNTISLLIINKEFFKIKKKWKKKIILNKVLRHKNYIDNKIYNKISIKLVIKYIIKLV